MSDKENFQKERWIVCGALCTIHDILLKKFGTESLDEGEERLIRGHEDGN